MPPASPGQAGTRLAPCPARARRADLDHAAWPELYRPARRLPGL